MEIAEKLKKLRATGRAVDPSFDLTASDITIAFGNFLPDLKSDLEGMGRDPTKWDDIIQRLPRFGLPEITKSGQRSLSSDGVKDLLTRKGVICVSKVRAQDQKRLSTRARQVITCS